ncbi:MAG: hypothetical protein AAGM67_10610, partial [Bacteroidota bacterium]
MTQLIRLLLGLLLLCLVPYSLEAQFMRLYTLDYTSEVFSDAKQTTDGGYIALGDGYDYTPGQVTAYRKMFLIKTDAVGDTLWTQHFDQADLDSLDYRTARVLQTSDGGYLVMANQTKEEWGLPDTTQVVLVRTNPSGSILWSRTYLLDYQTNWATDLIQSQDGGFVFAGSKTNAVEYFLYKVDAQGDSIWSTSWASPYRASIHAIVPTADGGFTLGGWVDEDTLNPQTNNLRMYLRHFDSFGNQVWYQRYGVFSQDFLVMDMNLSASGKYAFALINNDTLGGP